MFGTIAKSCSPSRHDVMLQLILKNSSSPRHTTTFHRFTRSLPRDNLNAPRVNSLSAGRICVQGSISKIRPFITTKRRKPFSPTGLPYSYLLQLSDFECFFHFLIFHRLVQFPLQLLLFTITLWNMGEPQRMYRLCNQSQTFRLSFHLNITRTILAHRQSAKHCFQYYMGHYKSNSKNFQTQKVFQQ